MWVFLILRNIPMVLKATLNNEQCFQNSWNILYTNNIFFKLSLVTKEENIKVLINYS